MMGICNAKEFDKELEDLNSSSNSNHNSKVEILPAKGRGKNNNEVPESLRKIIGEESIEEGRQSALGIARAFGISDSSVSAYSNGSSSTASYHNPTKNLSSHLNKTKERIQKKARNRLTLALDSITPEKLQEANLREASGIARDMSVIIKNLEPESDSERNSNTPQFVIYVPIIRDERSFESIVVNE